MNKVLITGGAGFIGSNLTDELLRKGFEVTVLDIKKNPKNLGDLIAENEVDYVNIDIRSNKLADLLKEGKFDIVVHLAAVSRVVWCEQEPSLCRDTNKGGTENLLRGISSLSKKPGLIFSSSREVYGNQRTFPVSESALLSAINTYAATKIHGENVVREFSYRYEIPAIIYRLSNVYGNERDILDRVVPKFILNALMDREITVYGRDKFFDFTFIDDTVNAFVNAIERMATDEYKEVKTYNICTGAPTRLEEVPELISRYVEKEIRVRFEEPREYEVKGYYGTYEKARRDLNFEPRWSFEEGLKYTIDRLKAHLGVILG